MVCCYFGFPHSVLPNIFLHRSAPCFKKKFWHATPPRVPALRGDIRARVGDGLRFFWMGKSDGVAQSQFPIATYVSDNEWHLGQRMRTLGPGKRSSQGSVSSRTNSSRPGIPQTPRSVILRSGFPHFRHTGLRSGSSLLLLVL